MIQSAVEALKQDASQFSPLVLYGPSGCGKSHLLQGLTGVLVEKDADLKILAITGSDFAREYGAALRQETANETRTEFFGTDVLVLEDLHELLHFPSMQQVLLHLLDELERRGCTVLVSCRENPIAMEGFSAELRSRLSSGLLVPVVLPEQGTREVLIQGIATRHNRQITKMAAQKLATAFPHGLLQLSGIVNRLIANTSAGQVIDTAVVDSLLQSEHNTAKISLRSIANMTAKYFRVKVADMKGSSRRQSIVQARSVAMLLARQLTEESLKGVGKHFGGRDHTTVMHAVSSVEAKLKKDVALREAVAELRESILQRSAE
ncbi:helix-turn-helix domain-containing protein [Bremerella sp. T1]|uniref:helix-turn-helix domain-containing protein n=1 Tax=Bremerella sp. TYQ1 TaxID=3119568 RepID=UPI0021BC3907|nr:DnaA/Hda family protein [Bremerella volcania]